MANNIFREFFGDAAELTAALNRSKFNPGTLARLALFTESGISSTTATIDVADDALTLLPTVPRGGVASVHRDRETGGITVSAVHIPTRATVLADSVQNRREFGGVGLDSPEQVRTRILASMRTNLELTIEHHRYGAIKGQIIDTDGSVLMDSYAAFGISQTVVNMDLASTTKLLLNTVIAAERESERALGGNTPTGFLGLASPDFMDSLRANLSFSDALKYAAPSDLLKEYRNGIQVGDTFFIECRSTPGLPARIPAGEAYLVPQGISDLLITRYAPGDYVSTVNQPGLPLYVQSEEMPMGKGYYLEAQSNPINLCTRPGAIIKLTKAA
jgi:hypothetical protein